MKNKNTPTEGQNSDIQTAESALRGAACCASFPVDCEGDLVEMTISKIKRSSGNIMSDPSELLEAVLFEAERLNPNQSLALQISCGPLDSFGDSIPPWFGSCERRYAHHGRSTGKAVECQPDPTLCRELQSNGLSVE